MMIDHREHYPEKDGVFWRYESCCTFSEAGDVYASIFITVWIKAADTPRGCWVIPANQRYMLRNDKWRKLNRRDRKLIIIGTRRRWAYPTKAEAWTSFRRRLSWREAHWNTEGRRIAALKELVEQEGNNARFDKL